MMIFFMSSIFDIFSRNIYSLSGCRSNYCGGTFIYAFRALDLKQGKGFEALDEDLTQGQRVREFAVYVKAAHVHVQVYWGKTIGLKAICNFPTVRGNQVTVELLCAEGKARLRSARVYYT